MTFSAGQFRVVRIIARLNVGGPALHVMNLSERLAGEYPTLLVTGRVDTSEADMLHEAKARGITVHQIPELGRAVKAGQDVVALRALVRVLRETRPSIVHTHTAKAGTLGRIAGVLTRVPRLVHTFHGHVFHGYFNKAISHGIVSAERALARATDRIVAISDLQAEDLSERYRVCSPERLRVIPLGLELDPFLEMDAQLERQQFRQQLQLGDRQVVSIVGRLVPVKNHELFLNAAALLATERRDRVFLIVGGGSEEARLRTRAAELGISEQVRFLGWRKDLASIYAGSDVVVLTSRNEGTPVAVIEALASRRPVVATDVGGVSDVLQGGRYGELVPEGEPDMLAQRIARVLDHREEYEDRAIAGARWVAARYAVQRMCAETVNLYNELGS